MTNGMENSMREKLALVSNEIKQVIKGKDEVNTPSIVIKDEDDSVSIEGNKINITSNKLFL